MSIESGNTLESAVNQQAIIVSQPKKLESLLDTINLLNSVSERMGEDSSKDLGGGSSSGSGQQGDDDDGQQTWRDQAIANLPPAPKMQADLQTHITKEMKTVRKTIKKSSKNIGKPGAACKLNELYARIRRLENILRELLEASIEVIERLYIRIFIDKQAVF